MTPNQETLLALLNRAKQEGINESNIQSDARIQELTQVNDALTSKVAEANARLASMQTAAQPTLPDGTPIVNIEALSTRAFFDLVPANGYAMDEYSAILPILHSTDIDDGTAERNFPVCINGKGDKMLVECDDEPTQTILPYKEGFYIFCLTPGTTYRWKMFKGNTVIKTGAFHCVGRVRWLKTRETTYPHNLRDIGCPPELVSEGLGINWRRIVRGEHPDFVAVDSIDHKYLRDQLCISAQLNLRDPDDDPGRPDLFERTFSADIPAYAELLSASTRSKNNFKAAFHYLVTELKAKRNILINCWQGRDRTGTFCWFLQALCHMKAGYLEAHWELSSFDRCENSKVWRDEEATSGELRTFISKMASKFKTSDPYAQALALAAFVGIPTADIEDFQSIMIRKPVTK